MDYLNFLSSDLIANVSSIAVAIGTIALAIGTYKSITLNRKTLEQSQTQLKILTEELKFKKSFSKREQIIEKIKFILTPLKKELEEEIESINKNDYSCLFAIDSRNYSYPELKKDVFEFFKCDQKNLLNYQKNLLREIYSDSPSFEKALEEQSGLYCKLNMEISEIKEYLDSNEVIYIIEDIIKTQFDCYDLPISDDYAECMATITEYEWDEMKGGNWYSYPINKYSVPVTSLIKVVKLNLFLEILKIKSDIFERHDKIISDDTYGVLLETRQNINQDKLLDLKNKIEENVAKIQNADEMVINQIDVIIEIYRVDYSLTHESIIENRAL